jgi:hypothetical protein
VNQSGALLAILAENYRPKKENGEMVALAHIRNAGITAPTKLAELILLISFINVSTCSAIDGLQSEVGFKIEWRRN